MKPNTPIASGADAHVQYLRYAAVLIGVWTLFRLWFCTQLELVGDEAYYWLWSKHLALSYYSKGPGVASAIHLGTSLFGDTVFGVRITAVVASTITVVTGFALTRALFDTRVAFWTVVVSLLMPLYIVGGFVMTIDSLSVCAWALAALLFWKVKDSRNVLGWMGVGVLIGLGTLAKYTNLAMIPSLALFCALSPAHRKHLVRPTFGLMLVAALACTTPIVIWNHQHEWITVRHLLERGDLTGEIEGLSVLSFLAFVGLQSGVVWPLFFFALIPAFGSKYLRNAYPTQYRFLVALFLPLFLFYALLSFNNDPGEANWTAPCYIAGAPLLTAAWLHWADTRPRYRRYALASIASAVVFSVLFYVLTQVSFPQGKDPFRRIRGWESFGTQIAALHSEHDASFTICRSYQFAAHAAFYDPEQKQSYVQTAHRANSQFEFWTTHTEDHPRANAIYVDTKSNQVPPSVQREFSSVELVRVASSEYRGQPVREFYFYLCRDMIAPPYAGAGVRDLKR